MEVVSSFFAPFFSVQIFPFFQMLMILSGLYTRSTCLFSVRLANLFTLGESALVWFVALMYKYDRIITMFVHFSQWLTPSRD